MPAITKGISDGTWSGDVKGKSCLPKGTQWGMRDRLKNIDFADDICLDLHGNNDVEALADDSRRVCLNTTIEKNKEIRINGLHEECLRIKQEVERVNFGSMGRI